MFVSKLFIFWFAFSRFACNRWHDSILKLSQNKYARKHTYQMGCVYLFYLRFLHVQNHYAGNFYLQIIPICRCCPLTVLLLRVFAIQKPKANKASVTVCGELRGWGGLRSDWLRLDKQHLFSSNVDNFKRFSHFDCVICIEITK